MTPDQKLATARIYATLAVAQELVLTEASGHVVIDAPRDRVGTFDPQIVKKRQRRLSSVDEIRAVPVCQGASDRGISAQAWCHRDADCSSA